MAGSSRTVRTRSVIVRHEDLVDDTAPVLMTIERKFGLQRAAEELKTIRQTVDAADWDQVDPRLERRLFNRAYHSNQGYATLLSAESWKVVDETIDWGIAAELGYSR